MVEHLIDHARLRRPNPAEQLQGDSSVDMKMQPESSEEIIAYAAQQDLDRDNASFGEAIAFEQDIEMWANNDASVAAFSSSSSHASSGCKLLSDTLSSNQKQTLSLLRWILANGVTQKAYSGLMQLNIWEGRLPKNLSSLIQSAVTQFHRTLKVNTRVTLASGERISWVSLTDIIKFWMQTKETSTLIYAANKSYTWPYLGSVTTLDHEIERRCEWLDPNSDWDDVYLMDSFNSINWLKELRATHHVWGHLLQKHLQQQIVLLFVHLRLFPDGLSLWIRREEGTYGVLVSSTEFPAATRMSPRSPTVCEMTYLSRTALKEIGWSTIGEWINSDIKEVMTGVEIGTNTGKLLIPLFFSFFFALSIAIYAINVFSLIAVFGTEQIKRPSLLSVFWRTLGVTDPHDTPCYQCKNMEASLSTNVTPVSRTSKVKSRCSRRKHPLSFEPRPTRLKCQSCYADPRCQ